MVGEGIYGDVFSCFNVLMNHAFKSGLMFLFILLHVI